MKYIIMADGKGTRWNNYLNIPKHFIEIDGETIIERTIRLLNEKDKDAEVIVTSHDKRYDLKGSTRYEPKNNILEIDRFTEELIENNICFLYGDTYYSDESIDRIINEPVEDILFFGNTTTIVAIKIKDGKLFKKHVDHVRDLFLKGEINTCKGWQVYTSFINGDYNKKEIKEKYIMLNDDTKDYNSPYDYEKDRNDDNDK